MPSLWTYSMPEMICWKNLQASFSLSLGESQVLPVLHDVVEELASGGVLGDQVQVRVVFDDLVELDDVRVSDELEDLDLARYPLEVALVGDLLLLEDLDRHPFLCGHVDPQPHLAEGALSQLFACVSRPYRSRSSPLAVSRLARPLSGRLLNINTVIIEYILFRNLMMWIGARCVLGLLLVAAASSKMTNDYKHITIEETVLGDDSFAGMQVHETSRQTNFYTISLGNRQNVVAALDQTATEMVHNVIDNKTISYVYFHCMYKDLSPCEVKFDVEDSLGNVVFKVDSLQNATYKISFVMTGEYKFSFANLDVPACYAVERKAPVDRHRVFLLREARSAQLRDQRAVQREDRSDRAGQADDQPDDGADRQLEAHRGQLREQ